MSHMIDQTTGRAAIAFVGPKPWHGLGHELNPDASIAEWAEKAGLDWEVLRSPVLYQDARRFHGPLPDGYLPIQRFSDREVLYRSDTGAPLGIASNDYKTVQPKQVIGFFDDLAQLGKFKLETAGALSGGKRIWALARIHDGAPIIGEDYVLPYLLLTTSFDGNMATTAKLTAIRVVCHNTLSVALHGESEESGAISTIVKVNHAVKFNASDVRIKLGIFADTFEKWMIQTRLLATQEIDRKTASRMALELTAHIPFKTNSEEPYVWPRESPAYQRIMALFDGQAIGSELSEGPTKWQFINSVTQWIDHERGRDPGGRLNSAWFGPGEVLKRKAYEIAMSA